MWNKMLSDRGSFSCFFRHSTEAAPSFLYGVLGNANPQPAKKSGLGKL